MEMSVEVNVKKVVETVEKMVLLRQEIEALQERATAAKGEIEALYGGLHGVAIGDTVETVKGRFVVTRIHDPLFISERSMLTPPHLTGRKIRKDGTPTEAATSIYDSWTKVA